MQISSVFVGDPRDDASLRNLDSAIVTRVVGYALRREMRSKREKSEIISDRSKPIAQPKIQTSLIERRAEQKKEIPCECQ